MKTSGSMAWVYFMVAITFAALGAAAVVICVKTFGMSVLNAGMVSLPVSYSFGMLAVWFLAARERKG